MARRTFVLLAGPVHKQPETVVHECVSRAMVSYHENDTAKKEKAHERVIRLVRVANTQRLNRERKRILEQKTQEEEEKKKKQWTEREREWKSEERREEEVKTGERNEDVKQSRSGAAQLEKRFAIVPLKPKPEAFYGRVRVRDITKYPQIARYLIHVRRRSRNGVARGGGGADNGEPDEVLPGKRKTTTMPACFRTFPRQAFAFRFIDMCNGSTNSHGDDDDDDDANASDAPVLMPFTFEEHTSGRRRFIATTHSEFARRYFQVPDERRHIYEIIREGEACHLYLDLEFSTAGGCNECKNGDAMVDALLALIEDEFAERFNIRFDDDSGDADGMRKYVLELDSTTPTKFSRHVVIVLPGIAFENNAHVGAFIRSVVQKAEMRRDEDVRCDDIFVQKEAREVDAADATTLGRDTRDDDAAHQATQQQQHHDEGDVPFVDLGVYSRNRAFRLPYSSKAGKTVRLLPTQRLGFADLDAREVLMMSLVCNVSQRDRGNPIAENETSEKDGQRLRRKSRDVNRILSCEDDVAVKLSRTTRKVITSEDHRLNTSGNASQACTSSNSSSSRSPYPDLDALVCHIATSSAASTASTVSSTGARLARIRSWVWFPDLLILLYNIADNRYCHNVGREHKSNGVYYIVDFKVNVIYQRCYDPDCKGFRSDGWEVPESMRIEDGRDFDAGIAKDGDDWWGGVDENWWKEAERFADASQQVPPVAAAAVDIAPARNQDDTKECEACDDKGASCLVDHTREKENCCERDIPEAAVDVRGVAIDFECECDEDHAFWKEVVSVVEELEEKEKRALRVEAVLQERNATEENAVEADPCAPPS